MCTIALLLDVVPSVPLVIAANRDELYARPTRPPARLSSRIAGGIDEVSGGTWLAIRADGRFAAVTNQRVATPPPLGLRSRGLAVKELAEADDPEAYVASISPAHYASMNLIWGDPRGVSIAYVRHEPETINIERLGPGIHVVCNDRLNAPGFPRGDRLREALSAALVDRPTWAALVRRIEAALADHTRIAEDEVPASDLPKELARELTATCIHSAAYGTRSSTIIAADHRGVAAYLHADGPPCTAAFEDRRSLLESM
jgi:uncharacterized protein with NRDE domain